MKHDLKKAKGLFIQILIVLLLFSIAVYSLWRVNLIKFPEFIENIISPDNSTVGEYAGDGFEIFEYISDASEGISENIYPEISAENMRDILLSLDTYDNFYWESTSKIYSELGNKSKICRSRISEKKYNIELLDNNNITTKKCISNGEKAIIYSYNGNNVSSSVYSSGLIDFYSDSGIISISDIIDTEYSENSLDIRRIQKDDLNLISVVYTYDRDGKSIKNSLLLSLDYGVILFAEIHENDKLVYSLTTTSIYSLESLDDSLFVVD